jgi:hypothetical protein
VTLSSRQELVAQAGQSDAPLAVDFDNFTIDSYGGPQDVAGSATVNSGGAALHMVGNIWKKIDLNYDVTAKTVLEFDFKSCKDGEIHGIGFDTDLSISAGRTFQVDGAQTWGIQDFHDYAATPGFKHYQIPVGQYYFGPMTYLFFVNDHDVTNATSESVFRNVRISERDPGAPPDPRVEVVVGPKLAFGNAYLGSIHGYKFHDVNGNGVDDHEPRWEGVEITMTGRDGKDNAVGPITVQTDTNGEYAFTELMPGTYTVTETPPPGTVATTPTWFAVVVQSRQELVAKAGQSGIGLDIDLDDFTIGSYGGPQDVSGAVTIEDGGETLHTAGNVWKRIDLNYNVTADTVLEFDFQSTNLGEIHGIGLDTDLSISADKTFQLYGTQIWGIQDFHDYSPVQAGYQRYQIPVGQYYTGPMSHLFFVNDHDTIKPTAESSFHNVRIREGSVDDPRVEVVVQPKLIFGNRYSTDCGDSTDQVLENDPDFVTDYYMADIDGLLKG